MHVVILYSYANDQRVVLRVVKTSCIFLRESNYGAFSLCYLQYRACQLNVLDHPKVCFTDLFRRPNGCRSSYDHSYVPYGGSWSFIIQSGVLLLRGLIHSPLSDEFLQLCLFNKGFNLLFQVITIGRVMTVVSVKAAILVPRAPVGISLQLFGVSYGLFVFDLHQNLINRGN